MQAIEQNESRFCCEMTAETGRYFVQSPPGGEGNVLHARLTVSCCSSILVIHFIGL